MVEFEQQRFWARIDQFEKRIDDTCVRIARIDEYIKNEKEKEKIRYEHNNNKIKYGFAVIGAILALTNIYRFFFE